jgi:hypothetical protein
MVQDTELQSYFQERTAHIRKLAEDLRTPEDREFRAEIADEYERLVREKLGLVEA